MSWYRFHKPDATLRPALSEFSTNGKNHEQHRRDADERCSQEQNLRAARSARDWRFSPGSLLDVSNHPARAGHVIHLSIVTAIDPLIICHLHTPLIARTGTGWGISMKKAIKFLVWVPSTSIIAIFPQIFCFTKVTRFVVVRFLCPKSIGEGILGEHRK